MSSELTGPRVTLRRWRMADRPAFAAINADPQVTRYFTSAYSRAQSDAFLDRIEAHFEAYGFGFWAVATDETPLIGLVGLQHADFEAPFTPAVEIGWRLSPEAQGKGLALEAARLALAYGFDRLGLGSIIAFTVPANTRSWGLMERLGMRREMAFEHPLVAAGHPLRPHLLYRVTRAEFAKTGGTD